MTVHVPKEKPRKLLAPGHARLLWFIFGALLALSVLAQAFVLPEAHFNLENEVWFYPVYGFGMSALLVLVARGLGIFLQRPEKYWEDDQP